MKLKRLILNSKHWKLTQYLQYLPKTSRYDFVVNWFWALLMSTFILSIWFLLSFLSDNNLLRTPVCHWCVVSSVWLGWHLGKSTMTWTTASWSITYRHYFDIIVILCYNFSVLTGRFRANNRRVHCPPAGAAAAARYTADRNL